MHRMIRVISVAVVETLLSTTALPPARPNAAPTAWVSEPPEPVDSLHQTGEELFDAGDYAGARVAWTEAYERIAPQEDTWPYRATLLSLIVTATLSEFSGGGARASVREAADLVDAALDSEIDDEVRLSLESERERLSPYLDPVPSPEQTPPPAEIGQQDAPPDPPPDRKPLIPAPAWIGSGGVLFAGGITAVILGSRFGPRATDQVMGAGDPTGMPPGSTFISDERRKGTAWMATGGTVAAIGVAALVIGIVRLTRDRK